MADPVPAHILRERLPSDATNDRAFILTNHPGRDKSSAWFSASDEYRPARRFGGPLLDDIRAAWGLFRRRKSYRVVVLGGGSRIDTLYLVLQSIWPVDVRPVIKLDCLWYHSVAWKQFLKKRLFSWLDKQVSLYVVWASRECDAYADEFGLPRQKFRFVPYHTTIDLSQVQAGDRGYLFSGGNFARDYSTLVEAVKGLGIEVIIACSNPNMLRGIDFPEHVTLKSVTHREFMQLMAESFVNVVPLKEGLLHSGGQQTFLNAMLLGKPVIVTDPDGAKDYIDDGVDGLLVPPADPLQLRKAIAFCYQHREQAAAIGRHAANRAASLDTDSHLSHIVWLARQVCEASSYSNR